MLRCPRCQHPLTFAGVTPGGDSVYACTSTLFQYDKARATSFPCLPENTFFFANGDQAPKTLGLPFAKRDKKGNPLVQTPNNDLSAAPMDPATPFAREYAKRLAKLDDLPSPLREDDHRLRKPVMPYLRLKGRKAIEAWAKWKFLHPGELARVRERLWWPARAA